MLTALGVLPIMLIGALAPFAAADLDFSEFELGLGVSLFFVVSAVTSVPAGRLVERLGSYASGWIAGIVSTAALVALGLAASSSITMMLLVGLSGIGNAFGQLSANLAIARAVPSQRQGLAFGIKQAAVPLGSLIGGMAVPLVALTVGWRWAFAIAPLMFLMWLVTSPRAPIRSTSQSGSFSPRVVPYRTLVVLAGAVALGSAGGAALATFLVSSAISIAVPPAVAGLLLALGSALGLTTRVIVGWAADRMMTHPLNVVAMLMGFGGVGMILLGSTSIAILLVGVVVGFSAGWGWNGLLNYAVVRDNPDAPARATGITQAGLYVGGIAGPLLFGLVVEQVSYQAAWLMAGGFLFSAAMLVRLRPKAELAANMMDAADRHSVGSSATLSGPGERPASSVRNR